MNDIAPVETPILAAPLPRLAASVVDAAMLLALHLLALQWLSFSTVAIGGLVLGWIYLWLCWWLGATIGQRLFGLRVVTLEGDSLSLRRAAGRCAAYALASLPFKIGLLPILWDAHRQGWHDRLCGTLVIQTGAKHRRGANDDSKYRRAANDAPPLLETWPLPDWRFARRGWPILALIYLLVAIVLTWPVAARFSTHFAGGAGDNLVFAWNYWHFAQSLHDGRSPMSTDLFYWPHTISLRFHTMQFHNCVLSLPLQGRLTLVQIYNLLLLLTFAANALAAYLCAAALTRDRLASGVAALAFGFCPYLITHANGHANLIAAQYLPLFAVAFYGALAHRERKSAWSCGALAAACLSLNAWCDWQYWFFALLIAAALWLAIQGAALSGGWSYGGLQKLGERQTHSDALRRIGRFGAIATVGTLPLLPLLLPMMSESGGAQVMDVPLFLRADPADWFAPAPKHPISQQLFPDIERRGDEWVVAPGLTALVLAGIGLWSRRRALRPWLALCIGATILACGPSLTIGSRTNWPLLVPALVGGAPGNGLSPPHANAVAEVARQVTFEKRDLWNVSGEIALPFADLRQALPPLKSFRVPSRFAVVVALCISLAATFGLMELRRKWHRRAHLGFAACALLMLIEYVAVPHPTFDARIDPFYRRIGADRERYAIIEAPWLFNAPRMSRFEWFQTAHGKPMFGAYISRAPRLQPNLLATNAVLQLTMADAQKTGELAYLREWEKRNDGQLRAALRQLQGFNARYLIVHRAMLNADNLARLDLILRRRLKLRRVDDGELRVYDLRN